MKKRIIASDIPTAHEVLGDNGAAVYFETGNSIDLANKIRNIDELLPENYVELQSERLELFDAKTMAQKIETTYNTVCNNQ